MRAIAAPMPLEPPGEHGNAHARTVSSLGTMTCMDRRERERIYGQWGGKPGSTTIRATALLGDAVARDLEGSPLRRPAERYRARNFRPTAESYIASLGGPLPYMRRLRADRGGDRRARAPAGRGAGRAGWSSPAATDEFAARWERLARRWRFDAVNELIERHNRFYPAEARLPMDPTTRDYALVNGRPYRLEPLDAAWILERFPASVELAA